jgi:hypothetical protein
VWRNKWSLLLTLNKRSCGILHFIFGFRFWRLSKPLPRRIRSHLRNCFSPCPRWGWLIKKIESRKSHAVVPLITRKNLQCTRCLCSFPIALDIWILSGISDRISWIRPAADIRYPAFWYAGYPAGLMSGKIWIWCLSTWFAGISNLVCKSECETQYTVLCPPPADFV